MKYTLTGYIISNVKEEITWKKKKECCCHHKTKERSDKEYKDLINRLSRIEGQVRGIKKMVENDTYLYRYF